MKPLVASLLLLVLLGCASQSKKNENDEFSNITNDSFNMPPAKLYQIVDDFIDEDLSDEPNVLKEESIAKVPTEEVEEPEDVEEGINKILLSCYKGAFKEGFELIDSLYKEYRKNPIYWTQVGSCYLLEGSKRKALLYYNKARDIKRNYAPPINNIGVIFEKSNFDQKALKAYEETKRVSSFSLTPLFNLAQLYTKYGFIDEAKALFESMYRRDTKDQDVIYALGFIYFVEGQYSEAIKFYRKLSDDYYGPVSIGANVAYAFALSGDRSEARDILSSLDSPQSKEEAKYLNSIKDFVGNR